jgi:hypothetical protein
MRPPPGQLVGLLAVLLFVGGCVGGGAIAASWARPDRGATVYAPLPHHVPPSPDATPFRFAMVHDVIHERYPRHGPAYYAERERLARERLAVLHPESDGAFGATDDVAVSLDRRGRTDEATTLMRDKLRRQQTVGLEGKELYSTYANLGEFLVRGNLRSMMGGDAESRKCVEEGRDFLRRSIVVNPTAHFGREDWQVVAVNALLDMGARPGSIHECDLIGNRLDVVIDIPERLQKYQLTEENRAIFGRPYLYCWADGLYYGNESRTTDFEVIDPEKRAGLRKCIFPVGNETPPAGGSQRGRRAPFDEPALWLVGEWREGTGPDPHLALCLGEIMLRVGQRYLAWNCYERASRLADQFWPTPEGREFLRNHCAQRQATIEASLPRDEVASLRPKFDAELAFGEAYQRDYQAYEEQKILAAANPNDEHFYDEFHAGRPPIASKVGPEEWYAGEGRGSHTTAGFRAFWEWGLLTGGACVLLMALVVRRLAREVTPRP